jgi:methylated-DNA-[protein]-cysteine S-methyltransferase
LVFDSFLGKIFIKAEADAITEIGFLDDTILAEPVQEGPLVLKCKKQLTEYFAGKRVAFDLPLAPKGTGFQRAVWDGLLEVPYGKTSTYSAISVNAGCPSGARAAGQAIGRNPIAVVIPCHRIIRSDGALSGFAGGVWRKKLLLKLEGAIL